MALIFPRLAHNYIKRGYYPTDIGSLDAICRAVDTTAEKIRIADPCCGEGAALLHLTDHLKQSGSQVEPFAIEVDDERAWRAKEVLKPAGGNVAHADMHDVIIRSASFGFLFLNPPYGDTVTDSAGLSDDRRRDRHEKIFCRAWFPRLQIGGVLALLVPYYVLDTELSTLIARHFERVQVFLAPEQQFQQAIVIGIKRRPGHPSVDVVSQLTKFAAGEGQEEMPSTWSQEPYWIPQTSEADFSFALMRIDARQLDDELNGKLRNQTLWPKVRHVFRASYKSAARRPLCPLSDWHLALALAAGQITGVVRSNDQVMLVKGATHKTKAIHQEIEHGEDGSITQTTVAIDKFVPMIKAIEFTPGSPNFGRVITIR